VVVILTGILTFVMLKIVPVFQKMFEEFGLELPAVTIGHQCLQLVRPLWLVDDGSLTH
jgi:type II secretory pathway component PulF